MGANGGKGPKTPHEPGGKEKKQPKNKAKVKGVEPAGMERGVGEKDTVEVVVERREEESDEQWEERKVQSLRDKEEEMQKRLSKASNKRVFVGAEGEEEDVEKQVIPGCLIACYDDVFNPVIFYIIMSQTILQCKFQSSLP